MSGQAPELSIIIPAYNEEKRLRRSLQRICEYFAGSGPQQHNIEIIVVDDGSTDHTADLTPRIYSDNAQLAAHFKRDKSREGL